jgi:hypothetical protein
MASSHSGAFAKKWVSGGKIENEKQKTAGQEILSQE